MLRPNGPARPSRPSCNPVNFEPTTRRDPLKNLNPETLGRKVNGECRSEWIGRSKQSSMVFEGVCKAGERTLGRYLLKNATGASYRITATDFEARPWKAILSADGRADIRGTLTDTQFFKSASGESSLTCSISNTVYIIECQSPQASSE